MRQDAIDRRPQPTALVRALLLLESLESIIEVNGNDVTNAIYVEASLLTVVDVNPDAAYFLDDFDATQALYTLVDGDVRLEAAERMLLTLFRHRHLRLCISDWSPLLSAAACIGSLPIVRFLHDEVDGNVHADDDVPAFHRTIIYGHLDLVRYFVEVVGTFADVSDDVVLYYACVNGHVDIIRYFIESRGVHLFDEDNILLCSAAEYNQLSVVRYLVEKAGINDYVRKYQALRAAIRNGHVNVVRYFVESANAITADDDTKHSLLVVVTDDYKSN